MIKYITIVLGDNDFGNTFSNMLHTLRNLLIYNQNITEDQMTLIIHEGIRFHYIAFQTRFDMVKDINKLKDVDATVAYIKEGIKIYYNERACKETQTFWDSGAWFLDVDNNQVTYL